MNLMPLLILILKNTPWQPPTALLHLAKAAEIRALSMYTPRTALHIHYSTEMLDRTQQIALLFDLGCSTGRLLCTAANALGCHGMGIDFNPALIHDARLLTPQRTVRTVTYTNTCIKRLFVVLKAIQSGRTPPESDPYTCAAATRIHHALTSQKTVFFLFSDRNIPEYHDFIVHIEDCFDKRRNTALLCTMRGRNGGT